MRLGASASWWDPETDLGSCPLPGAVRTQTWAQRLSPGQGRANDKCLHGRRKARRERPAGESVPGAEEEWRTEASPGFVQSRRLHT